MNKEYKPHASAPQEESDEIALPARLAGSGTLDRLIETARDYAKQADSENTLKAYVKDWAHFTRWRRRCGADPLPPSPEMIGLYLAYLASLHTPPLPFRGAAR